MAFPVSSRALALAAAAVLGFSASVRAVEIVVDETAATPRGVRDPGTRVAAAEVAAASTEGGQALDRMQLPPGLKASLWAAEPLLANPVAFNFDEQGRVFVAETYRYRTSVLDIRDYLWMLEPDLASRTIEDRMKVIAEQLGPEGMKELSIESERLRLIEDRDGDGRADYAAIYAEGFNAPLDGIASGVLARRGEVWFTNIPSVWKFTGREKAETRIEISRGYGVRFNYTGHDLHGLIWGPDGKLYFSCGDRGTHVPLPGGGAVSVPDTGAVFRCNPDGSELEIVATGLRNPQSLLFTENGDLFTGDNDSDQGDEERLVHVVEGGDSGWRVGYQFAPRGDAGPWNAEKMWHPCHAEQAAFLLPPIANIEDGPSGVAYYPGTGLNERYRGAIFITHFKGSIPRSGIYAYQLKPDGASYAVSGAEPFLRSALPTDVRFGPDGKLYYSDWAEGWPKSQRGRIYAIFDPEHVNDPLVRETKALIASDYTKKAGDELLRLLGHADWRVRLEAQFTLAERGAGSVAPLKRLLGDGGAAPAARLHATWALGQVAEKHAAAAALLPDLLTDRDDEVRAQAVKLAGDRRLADTLPALVAALRDPSARVRFFAAQSLGKLGRSEAAEPLLALLRENNDQDAYLRHAAVMGLVGAKNDAALTAAAKSEHRAVRLGVLLAWRRLERPEIATFLRDDDRLIAREAALAINDAPVNAAMPALAALLVEPVDDEPVMLRAINAAFRLGQPEHARALADYAARADAPETLRAEALAQLSAWPKPPARDRIVGVFRPVATAPRDAVMAREALNAVVSALLAVPSPEVVKEATIAAIESLELAGVAELLAAVVRDAAQPGETRTLALQALARRKDPRLDEWVTFARDADAPALRLAALPIAAARSPEAALPLLERLAQSGTSEEQKVAYRTLGTLQHPRAETLLAEQLQKLRAGQIPPAAQLELLAALEQRTEPEIKRLLAEREDALTASGDVLAPYRVALEGGNARKGARIFMSQPVMSCVRCHSAGQGGGDAGPNLAMIGTRVTREYLLESVVKPNAHIAAGFDTIVVTLKTGGVVAGVVAEETPETLSLRDVDGKVVAVKKADIAAREGAPSSMPEIYGAVLTKAELRDVVEFLASLTREPQDVANVEKPRALRTAEERAALK